MEFSALARLHIRRAWRAAFMLVAITGVYACSAADDATLGEDGSLLSGRITSDDGAALAGIPVRARGAGDNFSVVVYSGSDGVYSFPAWSDLNPGDHTVSIELPDFEHARRDAIALVGDNSSQLDFALIPREPSIEDATASEIMAALPGTNQQKVLFAQ